ncbi:MAG: energy transducer TonB [Magnetococcales bacterium]|nr:energy transducer TonB [Magnetococcales bacterium]
MRVNPGRGVWFPVGFSFLLHAGLVIFLLLRPSVAIRQNRSMVSFEMVSVPTPPAPSPASPPAPAPVVEAPVEPPKPLPPSPVETVVPPSGKKPVPARQPVKPRRESVPRPVSAAPAPPVAPPVAAPPVEKQAGSSDVFAPPPAVPAPLEETDRPPDVRAAYASNPPPDYPSFSRRMGHEGTVLLTVTVTAEGLVAQVEIRSGSGFEALDRAAQAAVARWHFLPARRNGHPVAAIVTVPVRFRLQTE